MIYLNQEYQILHTYYKKSGYIYEYIVYLHNGETEMIAQHRRLWEEYHNQILPKGFEIHHLNHKKGDNSIWNLLAIEKVLHTLMFHDIRYKLPSARDLGFTYIMCVW